jgi:glycosyltransferase involved in cell wall biosynthesis
LIKPKYSLVLPCFNEEQALILLETTLSAVSAGNCELEIILVDNGSFDCSRKVLQELITKFPTMQLVVIDKNLGYGNGILEGVRKSASETIIWSHSDMQCDVRDVLKAIELWESNGGGESLYVKGKRNNRSKLDEVITSTMSAINYFVNRVYIPDINSQPNMLSKKTLLSLKNIPLDATFELFVLTSLVKKYDMQVVTFPVIFHPRIGGVGANEKLVSKISYAGQSIRKVFSIWRSLNDY